MWALFRILLGCLVAGISSHSGDLCAHSTLKGLVAWLREFRRTVEIITRTLREVVTRVRSVTPEGDHEVGYYLFWLVVNHFCLFFTRFLWFDGLMS